VVTGRTERDITPDLRGALQPTKGEHFAAITEPKAAAGLLRCIDDYQSGLVAKSALKLAPLVFSPGRRNGRILTLMLRNGVTSYLKPPFNISYRYRSKLLASLLS
jgi:hypothetical protein